MRWHGILAPLLFVGGIAAVWLDFSRGSASTYWVLIVPVVTSQTGLAPIGLFACAIALFLGYAAIDDYQRRRWPEEIEDEGERIRREVEAVDAGKGAPPAKSSFGGVVMLGPIPIAFGNAPKMTRTMLAVAAILVSALIVLYLVLFLLLWR